ncbi:MAG: hypothetical protein KC417_17105, partial [Myxococcales bacterium]|nr:hypothetical protein [Myxococcales bacterium]
MNRDVFKRWLRDPLAWCVLLGAGFVVYRVLGLFHNVWSFTTDDAYITLRYARNWHDGHGITWNAGEKPVEGYSNFLFVVLGYIALTVGASPEMFIKAVSLLALLGSVVLIYRLGRPILGRIGAIAPVLFFVTDKGVLWWTFSGLETIVYAAFALAAFHLYLRATDMAQAIGPKHVRRSLLGESACIFLASVTRFEGPILGVALAGASLLTFIEQAVRARRTGAPAPTFAEAFKPIVIVGIAAAVPYALYFVWRYAHFGELIPNSYACKLGTEGLAKRRYQDFVTDFMPLLAVAAVTLAFRRSLRHWVLAVPIILYVLLLRDTDTIVAYHNRHFV